MRAVPPHEVRALLRGSEVLSLAPGSGAISAPENLRCRSRFRATRADPEEDRDEVRGSLSGRPQRQEDVFALSHGLCPVLRGSAVLRRLDLGSRATIGPALATDRPHGRWSFRKKENRDEVRGSSPEVSQAGPLRAGLDDVRPVLRGSAVLRRRDLGSIATIQPALAADLPPGRGSFRARRRIEMKFVVRAQQTGQASFCKRLNTTQCALCSEDPRFCGGDPI